MEPSAAFAEKRAFEEKKVTHKAVVLLNNYMPFTSEYSPRQCFLFRVLSLIVVKSLSHFRRDLKQSLLVVTVVV